MMFVSLAKNLYKMLKKALGKFIQTLLLPELLYEF